MRDLIVLHQRRMITFLPGNCSQVRNEHLNTPQIIIKLLIIAFHSGWDFMIGNSETAHNKIAAIVMGFKEVILEEKEKKKDTKDWKLITCRVLANIA